MKKISISTGEREELLDITKNVHQAVSESGVKNGICVVYVPHTTAAVTINESADNAVALDIKNKLQQLIPKNELYHHSEGNSDAHIKSALIGCSVFIPVQNSKLVLGTWQGIFFCEFDGPRLRGYLVEVTGK